MNTFPSIITQEDSMDANSPERNTTTSNNVPSPTDRPFSKNLVQKDLFGRTVPKSVFNTTVSSYTKKNGVCVGGHSRKHPSRSGRIKSKPVPARKTNRVCFKKLKQSGDLCTKSVNLAFSLHVDSLKNFVRSVGKPKTPTTK